METSTFTRRSPLPSTNRSYRKSWFELVWAVFVSAKVLVQRPVNAIQADFCWELITQSLLAGNIPPYLAGSWKFSQRHPGSAEQLFFSQQEKKMKKCFQNGLSIMFWCSIENLLITVVGCPCAWGSKTLNWMKPKILIKVASSSTLPCSEKYM